MIKYDDIRIHNLEYGGEAIDFHELMGRYILEPVYLSFYEIFDIFQ